MHIRIALVRDGTLEKGGFHGDLVQRRQIGSIDFLMESVRFLVEAAGVHLVTDHHMAVSRDVASAESACLFVRAGRPLTSRILGFCEVFRVAPMTGSSAILLHDALAISHYWVCIGTSTSFKGVGLAVFEAIGVGLRAGLETDSTAGRTTRNVVTKSTVFPPGFAVRPDLIVGANVLGNKTAKI